MVFFLLCKGRQDYLVEEKCAQHGTRKTFFLKRFEEESFFA